MPSISSGRGPISLLSIAKILLVDPSSPPLHRTLVPIPSSPRLREPCLMSSVCSVAEVAANRTRLLVVWVRWRELGGLAVERTCSWVCIVTSPPQRTTLSVMTHRSRFPPSLSNMFPPSPLCALVLSRRSCLQHSGALSFFPPQAHSLRFVAPKVHPP